MSNFSRCLRRQRGGGLLCPQPLSIPNCLLATFKGGLYRYKQKTGLSKLTMVFKTLLSQLLIIALLAISTMSYTVIEDSSTLKQQAGIIVLFAEHPQAEHAWFLEPLNHTHPIFIGSGAYECGQKGTIRKYYRPTHCPRSKPKFEL